MQPVLKPAEQAVSGYNEGQKESRVAVLLKDGMGTAKKKPARSWLKVRGHTFIGNKGSLVWWFME